MNEKKIYRLNDDISFRKCSLFEGDQLKHGDCTDFSELERNWQTYYTCKNYGIHFHCTSHPAIELDFHSETFEKFFECPRCKKKIKIDNKVELTNKCLRLLNMEEFKDAKLVRLDDWYVPEIKAKPKLSSDTILSKIEVTLRDRKLTHSYDES